MPTSCLARHCRRAALLAGLLLLSARLCPAQDLEIGTKLLTVTVLQQVAKTAEERQALYQGKDDMFVRPGVLANRQERWVEVTAFATGFSAPSPIEFFVVGQGGKGYEALSVSPAKPSDIAAALQFIGMAPGQPVDFQALHFWPRGERVTLTYLWTDPKTQAEQSVRAEDLLLDDRTQKPLPPTGLAFVGSRWIPAPEAGQPAQFQANMGGEIASDFNEPYAVLDLPYRAVQEKVYGHLSANPAHPLTQGQALRLRLAPMLPAGETRVRDLVLTVSAPTPATAQGAADLRFTLTVAGQEAPLLTAGDFPALLEQWSKLVQAGKDLFLTLKIDPQTPVVALGEFARLIDAAADKNIIRPAPSAGQLYYQAFITKPQWLDREARIAQPLELTVAATAAGDVSGDLVKWFEVFPEGKDRVLQEHRYHFATLAELHQHLATKEEWETDALFFRVAPTTPYGVICQTALPLHVKFPTVFVFPTVPPAAAK